MSRSCPDKFLMATFAEEAGFYRLACHRVKPSSLPRGKGRSSEGSGPSTGGDPHRPQQRTLLKKEPPVPANHRGVSEPPIPAVGRCRWLGLVGTPISLWEGHFAAPHARHAGGRGPHLAPAPAPAAQPNPLRESPAAADNQVPQTGRLNAAEMHAFSARGRKSQSRCGQGRARLQGGGPSCRSQLPGAPGLWQRPSVPASVCTRPLCLRLSPTSLL